MCIALAGKIIKVLKDESLVDFNGYKRMVNTMLIENPKKGEYVLVHLGCAIEKISQSEAMCNHEILKKLVGEDVGRL